MIRCAGFRGAIFLNSVDFGAQGLQSICVFGVGHAPFIPSFGLRVGYGEGRRESTQTKRADGTTLLLVLIAYFATLFGTGQPAALPETSKLSQFRHSTNWLILF